jgi:transglutaminase/protease-like cytokinesis protein 3
MKKILSKFLLFILAVVIAACGFIVLCGVNPDVAKGASDASTMLDEYIQAKALQKKLEEEAANSAANASSFAMEEAAQNILEEVAAATEEISSFTVVATKDKEFSEYEREWSSNGLSKDVVKRSYEPLVNQDLYWDETDDTTYYSITDNLTGLEVPQRSFILLNSAEKVQQILSETSMGNTGKNLSFDSTYYPYYNMLTDVCRQLYKQIYANTLELNGEFFPVTKASPSEWNNALVSVIYDHPELFWLNTGKYSEYDYKGSVVKVQIYFYEDELGNIEEARTRFEEETDRLLAEAYEKKNDYEKEVYIHNLLAEKLTYGQNSLDQSAYSAIIGDTTVCAGYAKAFQYLMNKIEIPTYLAVGWGGGLISGDMHAWNIVKLGKDYYNVDVTWDDQEPINYNYFNQSDYHFHRHIRMQNSRYLPACEGTKYSKAPSETVN